MATALVLLAEGFEELEAVTIIDVLRRGEVTVTTASLGAERVTGSHQISLQADALLDAVTVESFDALVLPGGPGARSTPPCDDRRMDADDVGTGRIEVTRTVGADPGAVFRLLCDPRVRTVAPASA